LYKQKTDRFEELGCMLQSGNQLRKSIRNKNF